MSTSQPIDRITREETIFNAAVELREPAKRAAYLDLACEGDPALRARLEKMLAADEDRFFEVPLSPPSLAKGTPTVKPPAADPEPAAIGERIGRYKLLEKIGEGGCGVVYMGEQQEPVRRRLALKVIKLGMDTKAVIARFEAERQALAMMDHPHIAKVLDAGATDAGRPYFVMELVRGIRITEYCEQHNLTTRERLDLFVKVCQAIQHAHQKGIIHRDIKPSNILVTVNDGVAVPKVIDFGIAKATEGRLTDKTLFTQFEALIGTPAYMSPEQAVMTSLDIDTRSDTYSLGVLLYELLTGSTPFDSKELMASGLDAMRQTIREKEPIRPSTRLTRELVAASRQSAANPTEKDGGALTRRRYSQIQDLIPLLRGDLDWIVMKCLEKDRTRRYDTANALVMDIKRHLNNEPITARPPSAAYRFQKMVRRNRLAFAAVTSLAATLVLGVIVSTWQAVRATRAEREQKREREAAVQASAREAEQRKFAEAQTQKVSESQQQSRRLLYAADMNLAQQSLKLNNLGRARRLLDRHRPQPGEDDLRGWEWRFLWQLTRSSALVTLTNRPVRGMSVNFSPDGVHLAVGWNDGLVDLWNVPERRWIRALTAREYVTYQGRVAFSPVRNLLAATSEPMVVRLYDLDSGRESVLWREPNPDSWKVRDLSFSQDGSRLVIYAGTKHSALGDDGVWVVNVSTGQVESRHPTGRAGTEFHGSARLSPDHRHLYMTWCDNLKGRHGIRCLDSVTGQEVWQTEPQSERLTTLAISPDGRMLASGSGFEDPFVRVWDAETGRLMVRLEGHTSWVGRLEFTQDGGHLVSAGADQSIRFWETSHWSEVQVLRGHTDEVHSLAISGAARLLASASKNGDLNLWRTDAARTSDGYRRLPEHLRGDDVVSLNQSRVLLLPQGAAPEWIDFSQAYAPVSVPGIESSENSLGWFGTNTLCQWDGTNQILIRELRGDKFVRRGAVVLDSGRRPAGVAYNPARQLLAWTEGASLISVFVTATAIPGQRIELKSDIRGLVPLRFSDDGNYLLTASTEKTTRGVRHVWNVETSKIVASLGEGFNVTTFAAGGQVLVAAIDQGNDHEIRFYDLINPDRPYRRVAGRYICGSVAASPDGRLVAASSHGGEVRLFNPVSGTLIDVLHGHLNAAHTVAFSADGRRLISTSASREALKLWAVDTRQELLTLNGTSSTRGQWSADGNVILAGAPWQAWRAPSWEEIAAAEAKEKTETKQP